MMQTNRERVQDETWLGGKNDPMGIVEKKLIWPYQMVYAQTRICPREWDTQNSLRFWYTNRSPNPDWKNRPSDN